MAMTLKGPPMLPSLPIDPAQMLIGGVWRPAAATLAVTDPSTGEPLTRIARGQAADIDAAVAAAGAALEGDWGRMTAADRGGLLLRLAAIIAEHEDLLTEVEARDVGKPLAQARADARALVRYCTCLLYTF